MCDCQAVESTLCEWCLSGSQSQLAKRSTEQPEWEDFTVTTDNDMPRIGLSGGHDCCRVVRKTVCDGFK